MSNISSTMAPHARTVGVSPAGTITATNAQDALVQLDTIKAATTHTTHNGEVSSTVTPGYKKFADGTIIQWGYTGSISLTANTQYSHTVTLPIAFPSAVFFLSATTTPSTNVQVYTTASLIGFTGAYLYAYSASSQTAGMFWLAIGR